MSKIISHLDLTLLYFFFSLCWLDYSANTWSTHKCMQKQMVTVQSQHIKLVMECILIKMKKEKKYLIHFIWFVSLVSLPRNQKPNNHSPIDFYALTFVVLSHFFGFLHHFLLVLLLEYVFLLLISVLKNICSGHKRSKRNEPSEREREK